VHREELRSKLVAIMRERLGASIRMLPSLAESWPAAAPSASAPPLEPSAFAATTVRQLRVLESVLSPVASPEDVAAIFGRLGHVFGAAVAEAAGMLDLLTSGAEAQLKVLRMAAGLGWCRLGMPWVGAVSVLPASELVSAPPPNSAWPLPAMLVGGCEVPAGMPA
jgi:hypothetical protein